MDYRKFEFTDDCFSIELTTEFYTRTASGKSWKSKPYKVEHEAVEPQFYTNYITTIPFFNSYGDGASCRASWNHTLAGYLPTTVTTISIYREEKIVAHFTFTYKED